MCVLDRLHTIVEVYFQMSIQYWTLINKKLKITNSAISFVIYFFL
jgi:hypothetical protein